jgi:hypothetical protein
MTEESTTPPLHKRYSARSEIAGALDELATLSRRTLRVFDADLSECGYDRPERISLLRAILRGGRDHRVLMVVHDARFIESRSPRLLDLWRQFPEGLEIRRTQPDVRGATDAFAIADQSAYWHRHHRDHYAAELANDEPAMLRGLLQRFDELWQASEPTTGPTVLGL